jgi:DNA-directed RNA polymerase subunit beta
VPDKDIDFEFTSPNQFLGTHANLIPLQSAVQGGRLFYGARFANQALPINNSEAPLVQLKSDDDPQGRSFDEILGASAGAVHAKHAGTVHAVTPDHVIVKTKDGEKVTHGLYNEFPYNRKTKIHNTPAIKPGDTVVPGQLLAHSNFTDKHGTLALGLNARVGLVPYLGRSMDDAIVISESFAKRLASNHAYGYDLDYKRGVKGGKAHHVGLFPNKFINDQLDKLDDEGIVKPGQIVNPGDPIILATRPRVVSSASAQLGLLSKHMKNARTDASVLWEHETPGRVVDVHRGRGGVKLNIHTDVPTQVGDKLAFRSGGKAVISTILPDEHVPRTADGQPLEVLLNPQSIPSRVNPSLVYELLLGKVAKKTGRPYKLPAFTKNGEAWHNVVKKELDDNGLTDTEDVFDPLLNKKLENPITVGNGYVLKLHHTSASKISARGQGSYSSDQEPLHGGGEGGQGKRLSGLESGALLSSGAYGVLRDGATVRGTRNDQFWRQLRAGQDPAEPGSSFAWEKFRALLQGSGYQARKLGAGRERLGFWTDKDLAERKPIKVKTGDIVDLNSLDPVRGGLFDPALTGNQSWGSIDLPTALPNPAAEDVICKMLGLTNAQYRRILAGEESLPEHLLHPQ